LVWRPGIGIEPAYTDLQAVERMNSINPLDHFPGWQNRICQPRSADFPRHEMNFRSRPLRLLARCSRLHLRTGGLAPLCFGPDQLDLKAATSAAAYFFKDASDGACFPAASRREIALFVVPIRSATPSPMKDRRPCAISTLSSFNLQHSAAARDEVKGVIRATQALRHCALTYINIARH